MRTRTAARTRTGAAALALALLATPLLSGCSALGIGGDSGDGAGVEAPTAAGGATEAALEVDSQFTDDGTFQSHLSIDGADGLDFVYTLYPTKATPRTNEWYPKGSKYFTFTFQAYDLSRKIRDPFATKREVYLDTIKVTSKTITDGSATKRPFKLKADAQKITWDPEPLTLDDYGMLITNPKGSFELRNNEIGDMADDTVGLELTFISKVWIETKAGSEDFVKRTVKQVVPIAIFASDTPTEAQKIPVDAS
ncbi:MAG: hypothetical protein CMH83_12270 [Nocardioides sp.]|nr:hypothetical protein [Nocardioides sp.]